MIKKQMAWGLATLLARNSTAAIKRVIESSRWQGAGNWCRKGAGAVVKPMWNNRGS